MGDTSKLKWMSAFSISLVYSEQRQEKYAIFTFEGLNLLNESFSTKLDFDNNEILINGWLFWLQ